MGDSRHRWIVDAIDEEIATCEVDGAVVMRVPRWLLPAGAAAGDALVVRHRREGTTSTLEIALEPRTPDAPDPDPEMPSGSGDVVL
jgi:hypothetical protein